MREFVRRNIQIVPSCAPGCAAVLMRLLKPSRPGLAQRSCCESGGHGPCAACTEQQAQANVGAALQLPGASLDGGTRRFIEARFGHSFADVRAHTDEEAAKSGDRLDAVAYILGRDIFFARDQYRPGTAAGRWGCWRMSLATWRNRAVGRRLPRMRSS